MQFIIIVRLNIKIKYVCPSEQEARGGLISWLSDVAYS